MPAATGGREFRVTLAAPPPSSPPVPFSAAGRAATLRALGEGVFDVLVVGGGITGAGIARDAAMRGLRVALVERDDFGSGTSSRSSRLVHGGLRYLEHGHLHLVFEASRERRTLGRIAPHLVRPLAFLWPVYEKARVPKWKLRAGLLLYDTLSLFRNSGGHQALGTDRITGLEPGLRPPGLRGGARYYDAATDDARLTLATSRSAAEHGAVVANHVAVQGLTSQEGSVRGAIAVDTLDGASLRIGASVVVNAAGPWSDEVTRLAAPAAAATVRGTKGVHVAVPRGRVGNHGALTVLSPIDGRVMFILPAGVHTIIGTTETEYAGAPDEVRASAADVTYLLRSANSYFPGAHLTRADVVSAWAGIRPLADRAAAHAGSASREHTIAWSMPGLLAVSGGKLTTYRAMAEEVVDMVSRALARPDGTRPARARAATDREPLPGGALGGDVLDLEHETEVAQTLLGRRTAAEHLVCSYGSEWRDVWHRVERERALGAALAPPLSYMAAELHHAVEREMALTLADLLIRRLHVAFETRDNGRSVAPAVAAIVAPLLGWDDERIARELEDYEGEVERMFGIEE
ncbi:MAG: glycerol-3-phosphate dehydrogenase [Gemmatimonadaceae bacterium]